MLLRRTYGIGAREALTELPVWELDMLVMAAIQNGGPVEPAEPEQTSGGRGPGFARVPDELRGWNG